MTEREKMIAGKVYDAGDPELVQARRRCKELCFAFNQTAPQEENKKAAILRALLPNAAQEQPHVESDFWCDYGSNISMGKNFYANHNLVILDCAPVTFGDDMQIGPNCGFYTAAHPIDPEQRRSGVEFARSIVVGNNVWFGGGCTVLPGVTIGDNCVIGAGSVVTRDIPANSVAVGNPCRVLRTISPSDRMELEEDDFPLR